MKKTLTLLSFGLVALGSTVFGATLSYDSTALQQGNGAITIDGGFGTGINYGNITVSMALDATLLTSLVTNSTTPGSSSINIISTTGTGAGSTIGAAINTTGGISSTYQEGTRNDLSTDFRTNLKNVLASNTIIGATLSYTIEGSKTSGSTYYLTLQKSDGTFLEYNSMDVGLKTSSFKELTSFTYNKDLIKYLEFNDSVLTEQQIKDKNLFLMAQSIPEPSTATLGLLGLGALMLRRRRQA